MQMLPQALAAQGQPQQPPPQPQQPPPTPLEQLMAEYKKLEADPPSGPMFSAEEGRRRVGRNNTQMELGLLGQLSGDKQSQGVGAQVFKQALGDGEERWSQRGMINPMTGEETLDPEYVRAQREGRRGQILQRALAYQQAQDTANTRADAQRDVANTRAEAARDRQAMINAAKAAGGGGGGKEPNLVQVKDDNTGQTHWYNPKTGAYVGPVMLPGQPGADGQPAQGAAPLVRPDKLSGADETAFTKLVTSKASIQSAIAAVDAVPEAFTAAKGAPDLVPGNMGSVARAVRDRQLTPEMIASRAMVYNNVSAIIKERAGLAQSTAELKRLNGFLPSDLDGPVQIKAKLTGYLGYLAEQEQAMRAKVAGPRKVMHMGGAAPQGAPAAPGAAPKRLKFNPATGELE